MTSDTSTVPLPSQEFPKRRFASAGRTLILVLIGAAVGGGAVGLAMSARQHAGAGGEHAGAGGEHLGEAAPKSKPLYVCPMHPSVTSDHPGDCPICGMKLVLPGGSGDGKPPAGSPARKIALYRSPMNPAQTSPVPRKDEMGMDYVPVYQDETAAGTGTGTPVAGRAGITIDPARQQMIGLRTAKVARGSVGGSWRTVARVTVDPTRVRKTNVKVEGYVERIFVNFRGQRVRKGQALFTIYSPSLLAAQSDYLTALKARDATAQVGANTPGGAAATGEALISAARRKLDLWDVPAAEIAEVERSLRPARTLTVFSPIAGVVTAKNVVEGARLNPGDAPYEITDLGSVWALVDVYESDLAQVRVGMTATLTLAAYPGRSFVGHVKFVEPLLDPKTRTVKVHLHFPNPTGELKPELYGEVVMEGVARDGLRIPVDAVIHSGTEAFVFVAQGEGKFQPARVELGRRSGDAVEVVSGLAEGQDVVTRANFLVDSESMLRASLAALAGK